MYISSITNGAQASECFNIYINISILLGWLLFDILGIFLDQVIYFIIERTYTPWIFNSKSHIHSQYKIISIRRFITVNTIFFR